MKKVIFKSVQFSAHSPIVVARQSFIPRLQSLEIEGFLFEKKRVTINACDYEVRDGQMRLETLKLFFLLAEKGSLTAVAGELGLNQTTLGRQIKSLEDDLGFPLFVRQARGMILTEQGNRYLQLCKKVINLIDQETALIKEGSTIPEGTLKVVIGTGTLSVLTPHLSQFLEQFPKMNLDFLTTPAIYQDLSLEADAFFLATSPQQPNLCKHSIYNLITQ